MRGNIHRASYPGNPHTVITAPIATTAQVRPTHFHSSPFRSSVKGKYLIAKESSYSQYGFMKSAMCWTIVLAVLCNSALTYAADSIPLGPARPGVVHIRPVPARCNEYIAKAQLIIAELKSTPTSHRWVVVCSLDAWNYALQKAGAWGRTNTAVTYENNSLTIINGAIFEEQPEFYRHVIYHEAGHVICACSSEKKADNEARLLMLAAAKELSTPPAFGQ
jgi:hypothetical protein